MFIDFQQVGPLLGAEPYRFAYDRENFASWFTHVDEHCQRVRFWTGIKPGHVVFDVGAASGSYTLPALAQGAAHVYAWCPVQNKVEDPSIGLLVRSLDLNGWRGRCSILPLGAWSAPGWLIAHEREPMPEFFQLSTYPPPTGAMPVDRIDAVVEKLIPNLSRLDWVKLDVEGAEVNAIDGALETIGRFKPKILVENHLFKDPGIPLRIATLLEPIGYREVETMPYNGVSHTLWEPAIDRVPRHEVRL